MTEQTEFKVGDIVRVSKGEPDKPGYAFRLWKVEPNAIELEEIDFKTIDEYKLFGWTVELVERPVPPLPTKPGTLGWARRHLTPAPFIVHKKLVKDTWDIITAADVSEVRTDELRDFTEAVLIPKTLADGITAWADTRAIDGDRLLTALAEHLKGQGDE